MRIRTLVFGGALLSAFTTAAPLLAQRARGDWTDRCEQERRRARVCEIRESGVQVRGGGNGTLVLDGDQNDAVTVSGWSQDSIHVIARIQAQGDTRDEAQEIADRVKVVVTGTDIHAEGPSGSGVSWGVSFEVMVPIKSNLTVTTRNGPIAVEDVRGTIQLEAENGPISLYGVGGDVRARAENGPLHVELAGARWEGTGLDAQTVNGPVNLSIPANYSAHLETGTVNGPFDVDFPMMVTIRGQLNRISSDLGSGGAPVRVLTTNGPVQVRRG